MEKKISTDNLITLCHIIEETEDFKEVVNFRKIESELLEIMNKKTDFEYINKLDKIFRGEYVIGERKAKRLYDTNKQLFDIINKYSNLFLFINDDFENSHEYSGNLSFFYHYLVSHINELSIILSFLEKLKAIGINLLIFNEQYVFSKNTYSINTKLDENFNVSFLENLEVIPNYDDGIVKYRTIDSNYEINLSPAYSSDISIYHTNIKVNTLLIDPNRLPNTLSKKYIFEELLKLKEKNQDDCNKVMDSVALSVAIDDFYANFNNFNIVLKQLKNVKDKEQLRDILLKIKGYIDKMHNISSDFDESLIGDNSAITREILKDEKMTYSGKRFS